jgi:hypothetical protein
MKMRLCCTLLLTMVPFTWAQDTPSGQSLPAGIAGSWKLTRMLPKKPAATSAACTPSAAFFNKHARGTRVEMSDNSIAWGPESAKNPELRVRSVDLGEFNTKYAQAGATANELGLRSQKVEVIEVSAHDTLPFDTIVVRDPSTLLFERCGLFMEAVHDSGFVTPPLPNQTR